MKGNSEAIRLVRLVDNVASILKDELLRDIGDENRGHDIFIFVEGRGADFQLTSFSDSSGGTDVSVRIPINEGIPLEEFLQKFLESYAWR
ncbi:MAG: hypothetical protein LBS45_03985 [Synergistaceae bacterium]|jgi:hypothetical protein|nr:hypothetical protein [Synergistaceae bacterium]